VIVGYATTIGAGEPAMNYVTDTMSRPPGKKALHDIPVALRARNMVIIGIFVGKCMVKEFAEGPVQVVFEKVE
jgi:hypothetical protein